MNGAYSHAPIALLIFFFLVWRKRSLLGLYEDREAISRWGYVLIISGGILKIYGELQGYSVLRGITLIPILFGILLIKFPPSTCKSLVYPVLFLLFIIPLPTFVIDQLTLPLQKVTVKLVAFALNVMNYQIERSGNILMVKGIGPPPGIQEFLINQNCSGIRFMIALLGLGTLYVYLRTPGYWQGFLLVIMIVPLSILGNFLRVLSTVFMFFYIGPETAEAFFHEFSGIIVFCFTLASLFLIEKLCFRPKMVDLLKV